ncbi:protein MICRORCHIDIA 6-like isoform X2 [Zingiber officinale]|uniref:protein MICRORCHIDIA 6-like isoform X2 n=1 Tax=Zingiber officinale TaxID=94328 RepID=UPI001C4D1F5D|nr:protein MICRORCHIDIA 6-like isoform X2 [Zingiber officinale]
MESVSNSDSTKQQMQMQLSVVGSEAAAHSSGATDQSPSPDSCVSQGFEGNRNLQISDGFSTRLAITAQGCHTAHGSSTVGSSSGNSAPRNRQFWSAGEYEDLPNTGLAHRRDGRNRLCVHPKFLHSNATSHKWAFGAIAELLDNAVDEIQNGATFVKVDKFISPHTGSLALLVQDDGGGMDPEFLRRCMSFGFSDKQASSNIGQYGNGFKTSTMRLGADVIVFTRNKKGSELTQSVGLLSYTFLRQEGYNDIVVPAVDYSLDSSRGVLTRIHRKDRGQFFSNLSVMLKWSPFPTESELLKNFNDIGAHGTKIIIYNLWYNDAGDTELDFESDEKDILISGAPKKAATRNVLVQVTQSHIAKTLRYSLRVYCSILYLHVPGDFKIILRGSEVKHHYIARDLKYCECVKYRPQVGGKIEGEVVTTIGFLKEAPFVDIHGFNIYYKNRLILPFHRVASQSGSKSRGVVGVLEANFIKPTHDKQGFERSNLYQKLEVRLREMTNEYWGCYSHLIGYTKKVSDSSTPQAAIAHPLPFSSSSGCDIKPIAVNPQMLTDNTSKSSQSSTITPNMSLINDSNTFNHGQAITKQIASPVLVGMKRERRHEESLAETEPRQKQARCSSTGTEVELHNCVGQRQVVDIKALMQQNKEIEKDCLEHEKIQRELLFKIQALKHELEQVQQQHERLFSGLLVSNAMKTEKV